MVYEIRLNRDGGCQKSGRELQVVSPSVSAMAHLFQIQQGVVDKISRVSFLSTFLVV